MHGRAHVRLGDDEGRRLVEEFADLRGDRRELATTAKDLLVGIAQQPETGLGKRLEVTFLRVPVEGIFAHAEEGEVVVDQPLQESDRLGEILDRDRRRLGAVARYRLVEALLHGTPVDHPNPDIGEDRLYLRFELSCLLERSDAREMDMDETLAHRMGIGSRLVGDPLELAHGVALDGQDRMKGQTDFEVSLVQEAQNRIDQEGHVVIGDVDDCHIREDAVGIGYANLGAAGPALGEKG